jgi:head-tail adaptor
MDEQCTIEQRAVERDPNYGTEVEGWEVVAAKVWCNAQDVLPSRAESTSNGIRTATKQTRLRIQIDDRITPEMRVTLHGKGDRLMQIISGPAFLDDRRHIEFMLEGYSHGG